MNAIVNAPKQHFLAKNSIQIGDREVGIGEEREGQAVFSDEILMNPPRVGADAEQLKIGGAEVGKLVAEVANFRRAGGSVVCRIEKQDDLFAAKIGEPNRLAILILNLEIGGKIAFFEMKHESVWLKRFF